MLSVNLMQAFYLHFVTKKTNHWLTFTPSINNLTINNDLIKDIFIYSLLLTSYPQNTPILNTLCCLLLIKNNYILGLVVDNKL